MEPKPPSDLQSPAQEHLTKALSFQRMGLTASAERELELARHADSAIVSDPRYQNFHAQQAEQKVQEEAWKLPMRVGAGLLFTDLAVTGILWLLNILGCTVNESTFWGLVHIGVNLYLAIALLKLNDTARRTTIWWAVVGLIVGLFAALGALSWADVVIQFPFSGSLLVVLLGKPSKVRAGLAIAIFVLFYLGTICAIFVLAAVSATQ